MAARASLERLKFCNFKLKTLLNITRAINTNLPTEELLETYERLLREELNIGKVLIYAYNNKEWEIILESGLAKEDYAEVSIDRDLLPLKDINITLAIENPHLRFFDFIIPVFHNDKALAYILIGDFEEEQEGISPTIKHLHFIQTLTNVIIVAIENKRLFEENMKQERMKKELEMASKMQEMLIPDVDSFPKNEYIKILPYYQPHYEVGGDYYDFGQLSNDEMFFCIADVSGKGMSAAILMSNFQASINALTQSHIDLPDLVQKLNAIVNKNANGEKFITLFIAKYNYKTKILRYINAGHNPPILYCASKEKIKYLNEGCIGIGMLDEIPVVKMGQLKIECNTRLLCFTDGVVELEKNNIEDYGQIAAEKWIINSKSIEETFNKLKKDLNIDKKSNPALFDDITMLGVEFYL